MILKTTALLFFVLVSLCTCTSNQENRKVAPNLSYRMHNVKETSKESCFCFDNPDSNKLVTQLLDSKNDSFERLIVYMYRDANTKEIKMYTPSKEKQHLIPNIAFDVGDGLITITNETVNQVFDNNPNVVVLKPNNNIATVDKPGQDTIGAFTGEITQEIGVDTPSIKKNNNENNLYNLPGNENTDSNTNFPPINFINPETNVGDTIKELHYYSEGISSESDNENDLYSNNENWATPDQKSHRWHHYTSKYPNYYNPSNPTSLNYQDNNGKPYVTFDNWFDQQMQIFHQLEAQGDISSIDIETLKMLVMKTLRDNYMYVTTDGFLTNPQGTVLNMSNLILRPVLIGDSITYEKFLQKTGRLYNLSRDLPFLEMVLVTLVYPPKILGVIPLGKTYLPASSRSSIRLSTLLPGTITKSPPARKTHCNHGNGCYSQTVAGPSNLHSQIGVTDDRKITPGIPNIHEMHNEVMPGRVPLLNLNKGISTSNMNAKKITEPFRVNKELDLKNTRKFLIGGLMSKLLSLISNQPKKDSDTSRTADITTNLDEMIDKDEQVFGERSGFFEDYSIEEGTGDIADFRIIGGNAATSSGTPVSNKGRSGIIF